MLNSMNERANLRGACQDEAFTNASTDKAGGSRNKNRLLQPAHVLAS